MLELLCAQGRVAIAERDGTERLGELGAQVFPMEERRLPRAALTRRVVEDRLRQRGIVRPTRLGYLITTDFRGRRRRWTTSSATAARRRPESKA